MSLKSPTGWGWGDPVFAGSLEGDNLPKSSDLSGVEGIPTLSLQEQPEGLIRVRTHPRGPQLGSLSVPPSNVPGFFVLKDHLPNSQGRKQSQLSLAGTALGCHESCIHNTAVVGIIHLMGIESLKSLRKKKSQSLGITSISINTCECRELNYRIKNTIELGLEIRLSPDLTL